MERNRIIPPPVAWQPVSRSKLIRCAVQDLARSTARMLGGRVRTADRVEAEYQAGSWHRVLQERAWLRASDLASFLVGTDESIRVAKVGGRIVEISTRDYYGLRLAALADVMAAYAPVTEELVELGCGFGYNLFSLALAGRWHRLAGFDISANGTAAARAIAAHFALADRMRFDVLDLTDTTHPNFPAICGKTLFTFFCIEQVPREVENVVQNIRQHRPKRVIHIEPTTELLNLWRPMDLLNYMYVKSVDYQTRLFTTLDKMAGRGEVRVLARERLPWASTIHNDGFMIVWEPC